MRALRLAWLWQLFGAIMVASVLVTSLIPPPEIIRDYPDKLMHVTAYLVMAGWFGAIFMRRWHLRVLAALVAFGVLIEFLQLQTGYRSFEVMDMLADALGASIGIVLARTPLGNGLQWLDLWVVGA